MTSIMTIDSGMFRNPNRDLVVNIKGTKKPFEDDYSYPKRDWFWTGKRPEHGECPGVAEDGHMTSLPLPDVSEVRAPFATRACCLCCHGNRDSRHQHEHHVDRSSTSQSDSTKRIQGAHKRGVNVLNICDCLT
jgi:hypothetical protein